MREADQHKVEYYIDLDERGEFRAHVERNDETIYTLYPEIFEDGFMKHKEDLSGLQSYLVSLGIISQDENLEHATT